MKTRKIGPFNVSPVGLGCMNMSMGYGPIKSESEADQLLNSALDLGYDFLDTASMYGDGHNETLIGRYIANRRSEYVLASKCGIYSGPDGKTRMDGRPEVLVQTCEDSLQRLKTDVIDLYYLHRMDLNVPLEDSIGALGRLVEQGKIRTIGLSEVSSVNLRRAHTAYPVTALQSEYSLWSRTPERGVLDVCRELDITFVPFSPLARQFLTGKTPPMSEMTEKDLRLSIARPRFEPEAFLENEKLLAPFADIASDQQCSMAQLALAWLLAQEEGMIPIPGTKTMEYMIENIGATEVELDSDTVNQLDALINEDTVVGRRYTDALMASVDSEKD